MPETPDFTAHAGVALFPRTRSDLTSTTQCPACLQVLSSIPCANCGLDLGHPLAAELALVSADAAELLDTRVRLIGTIRFDTAAANAAASAPAAVVPAAAVQAPVQHAPVTPAPVVPAPDLPAPVPPAPMAPTAAATPAAASPVPTGPRRSSVQILLVIVGVSLLSIAATFFLVYAFINFGLIWRTAIIGTITVAAFAVATLLRRRGLVSTAEGIGALAVVLVYLDAYAMRANDLFGSSSADALGYWGAALVVSAAGFLAWHRFSGLRVASIAAFTAVTPGAGLLVAGLAEPLDDSSRVFLGFLAAALAGLVHPLASRLERAIPLTLASAALVVAFFLALVLRLDLDWASPLALVGVAIVAAAHTAVLARVAGPGRTLRGFGVGFAAMAALAVGAAAIAASYRALSFDNGTVAAVCSTTVIALVAWFLVLRTSAPLPLRVAGAVAIGMAVLALTVPTTIALLTTASLAVSSALLRPWRINAADPVGSDILFGVDPAASIVALAACVALTGGFVVVTGQLGRFRRRLYWALVALAIVAVPLLALQWAVLLGWYLLSAVGVAALVRSRHTDGAPRAPWATLALASGALGYAVSWASVDTWLAGTVAAVLLLLASRTALAAPLARAIGLGVAAILALVGAVALAQQSGLYAIRDGAVFVSRGTDASFDSLRFTSILSIALVGLSAASLPRLLSALDRRTLFFIGATATVLSVVPAAVVLAFTGRVSSTGADGPGVRSTLVEPLTSIVLAVVLLAALVAWLARRADASAVAERVAAGASLAAVTAWLLDSLAVGAAVDDGARSLAPVVAALLVGAGSIVAVARRAASPRTAVDTGVAVVASAGVLVAALGSAHLGWLALLLSAVTVLLMAISADGLIGSRSRRKHLGWVALALATIALWWRLADASVEAVEAYSLPLGGALLLIALLVWRTERRQPAAPAAEARGVAVAPLLLLIGSLVAIVPSAMATTSAFAVPVEGTGRAVVVGSAAAVLLLAGSLVRGSTALRPYLDAAADRHDDGPGDTRGGRARRRGRRAGVSTRGRLGLDEPRRTGARRRRHRRRGALRGCGIRRGRPRSRARGRGHGAVLRALRRRSRRRPDAAHYVRRPRGPRGRRHRRPRRRRRGRGRRRGMGRRADRHRAARHRRPHARAHTGVAQLADARARARCAAAAVARRDARRSPGVAARRDRSRRDRGARRRPPPRTPGAVPRRRRRRSRARRGDLRAADPCGVRAHRVVGLGGPRRHPHHRARRALRAQPQHREERGARNRGAALNR
jgi:hypothetical protein